MSYDTIRDKFFSVLKGLKYAESSQVDNFSNAPAHEHGRTFILKANSGQLKDESQRLNNGVRDTQVWQIQIAFSRSENNERVEKDNAGRSKDVIIAQLDNPANWTGGALTIHYKSWEIQELPNYFVLALDFEVLDFIVYT